MTNKIAKIFLTFFLLFFFISKNLFANPSRNLIVFAEPNIALPLTKIARLYSQKSNVIVSINFNSSVDLINEIDSGEPADVFISAHPDWIFALRQKGLVDVYNIGYIAKDHMVLVSPKSNKNLPTELQSQIAIKEALRILDQNKATLIIDNESNSSGKFSSNFVTSLAFNNLQLIQKLREDKSSILSIIKNSPESYALLLTSQITNDKDLKIISSRQDVDIFYEAMVVAGDNMELAREFLKFLKSNAAKAILKDGGFIVE